MGLGDGFLVLRSEYRDMRYADGVLQDEGRRYWNKVHGLRTMDVVGFLVWRSAYCDMRYADGVPFWIKEEGLRIRGLADKGVQVRSRILEIAAAEIGVREATGRNDGARVEEYLRYTGLGRGHEWCAAFVSWCYGQAGLSQPRNPWSPALFPHARQYKSGVRAILPADLFAIYGTTAKRINHVGIVRGQEGSYIRTIEGNSNNRVESRRRHVRTLYAFADWASGSE